MARRKRKKAQVKPESIRAVLRYLRERPWSSLEEIANGIRSDSSTVKRVIADELSLRTEKRVSARGGPAATLYALPQVPAWYAASKAKHEAQTVREVSTC